MTREGLHLSIELQQEVIRYGYSLLAKKPFQNCGKFRLCVWKTPGVQSRFTHPLALCKLAFFLIDAYEVSPPVPLSCLALVLTTVPVSALQQPEATARQRAEDRHAEEGVRHVQFHRGARHLLSDWSATGGPVQ